LLNFFSEHIEEAINSSNIISDNNISKREIIKEGLKFIAEKKKENWVKIFEFDSGDGIQNIELEILKLFLNS
jgi:hypothetical protein